MKKEITLKGPFRMFKKTKQFKIIKNNDIVKVSIKLKSGSQKHTRDNKIHIILTKNTMTNKYFMYIYHMFTDVDYFGRWYDANFPIDDLLKIKNILVVKIDNFEDWNTDKLTKATIRIKFSDNAIHKIRMLLSQCAQNKK